MKPKNSLFISSAKSGLIIGAVSIVLFILMYVADIKPVGIFLPILMLLISVALNIIIMVFLFKKYRTEIGGFISFRDAFLYCFVAFSVSVLLSTLFTFLFIQFIEPDYYKNIMEAQKTWLENYLAGKVTDEQLTEQLDKIDEQTLKMGSIAGMMKSLITNIIVSGIISLIMGAIMKKKPDMFDTNSGGVI